MELKVDKIDARTLDSVVAAVMSKCCTLLYEDERVGSPHFTEYIIRNIHAGSTILIQMLVEQREQTELLKKILKNLDPSVYELP